MVYLRESIYQNDNIDKHGRVEFGGEYVRPHHNPLWLLMLRWLLLTVVGSLIFGFGTHLMLQAHWSLLQSLLIISGVLMVYVGVSFFVRPKANYQNLGTWGGLINDPTQYSDNINRNLVEMEFWLTPGQFVAETILDTAHFLDLLHHDEDAVDQELGAVAQSQDGNESVHSDTRTGGTDEPAYQDQYV